MFVLNGFDQVGLATPLRVSGRAGLVELPLSHLEPAIVGRDRPLYKCARTLG